jgi:tRNA(Ile)-lysidine synthase
MKPGDRLLVAVSGGADSVALLRLLLELRSELGVVLAVAHFNHGLRGDRADADESFVADLAKHHHLQIYVEHQQVAEHAAAHKISLESAGHKLRYEWLAKIAIENRLDSVATAHTLNDQAETVMMKFLRGSGTKGLAGIYPEMVRGQEKKVRFIRPLLRTTRTEIEAYLESLDQSWREDESNLDRHFRRNRIRHELFPLLERDYNPNIRRVLSEVGEISRAEEKYWTRETEAALRKVRLGPQRLRLRGFAELDLALQRRVLKSFLDWQNTASDFHHIEAVRRCALGGPAQLDLTNGWVARREGDVLVVTHPEREPAKSGYSYKLPVPGETQIPEIGCVVRAVPLPANFANQAQPGSLLRADLIGPELWVRNWHPGDRFHVSYMGREHKLKDLFWEWKIPASHRPIWPVALKGTEIVWVRDIEVSDAYCWRPGDGSAIRMDCIRFVQVEAGR